MWPATLGHLVDEEAQRLGAGALLAALLDHAVDHLDDRLDRQRGGEQRLGVADAAALLEVVQRVEHAEHAGALDQVRGERGDVGERGVVVRPGGCELGAGEGDRAEAERHGAAVDTRTVMPSGATERAASSALCSVADSAPDNITATMCGRPTRRERAVGLLEPPRRGSGGARQLRRARAPGPELVGAELLAVDELLVAETDAQRHDLDAGGAGDLVGQVARAVGDDADVAAGGRGRGGGRLGLGHVVTLPRRSGRAERRRPRRLPRSTQV